MQRVQLVQTEVNKDQMALISLFVKAAVEQKFDLDWVETVLFEAVANDCINFNAILLDHIEIIRPHLIPPTAQIASI